MQKNPERIEPYEETLITGSNANYPIQQTTELPSYYVIKNGICYVHVCFKCTSVVSGSQLICNLPNPKHASSVYGILFYTYGQASVVTGLLQNGGLYIEGSHCTATKNYGTSFSYPVS